MGLATMSAPRNGIGTLSERLTFRVNAVHESGRVDLHPCDTVEGTVGGRVLSEGGHMVSVSVGNAVRVLDFPPGGVAVHEVASVRQACRKRSNSVCERGTTGGYQMSAPNFRPLAQVGRGRQSRGAATESERPELAFGPTAHRSISPLAVLPDCSYAVPR